MYLLFLTLLGLACLSSAILLFQLTEEVAMHSILGGFHIFACLVVIIMGFAQSINPVIIVFIATLAFLTLIVSVSEQIIDWIDMSSFLIMVICCIIAFSYTTHE